jgi:hypothetical protein
MEGWGAAMPRASHRVERGGCQSIGEIAHGCLLGGAAVVITPEKRRRELAGAST